MEDKYLDDITAIKNMMQKSSQFLSLSGLAGILAGCYALIGAWFANHFLDCFYTESFVSSNYDDIQSMELQVSFKLILIAAAVLFCSIITAAIFTFRKSKRQNESIWNHTSKRMIANFLIPLLAGGIFGMILLYHQFYGLVAPVTLIFYGMACLNASKYTLRVVRYLGLTIIIIGLFSSFFMGYGLYFWALGFGLCHIFYGSLMYYKYNA